MNLENCFDRIDLKNINLYLQGNMNEDTYSSIERAKPKNKLMVFISSTFTDTHKERNILHEKILPILQTKAIKEDIQVLFYDMRFGVKDENTLDHLTWIACKDAIEQCFEESDGMFFLSLQGDKYGYMPLPKYLEKEAFDKTINQSVEDAKIKELAQEWYCLDENFVKAQYELKGLKFLDHKGFWQKAMSALRDNLFESFPFEVLTSGESLLVHRSVTEWETLFAFHLGKEKCFWIQRLFEQTSLETLRKNSPAKAADLCDGLNDSSVKEKLKVLLKKMESYLSQSQIYKFSDVSTDDYLQNESNYLKDWENATQNYLIKEIDNIISKKSFWISNSLFEFGLPIEYLDEILHHNNVARFKSTLFIGREELIKNALDILTQSKPPAHVDSAKNDVSINRLDVSFYVVGVSGAGKTAFMSKLVMEIQNKDAIVPGIPVIVRYCGTSNYSLHGKDLVQSISMQILCIYERKEQLKEFIENIGKQSYDEAVALFVSLLAEFPVCLFIDSLDQLTNRDEARRKLSFLKDVKLHEKSRIVVSTLPDEKDEEKNTWKYLFFCEQRLKENHIPRIEIGTIDTNRTQEIQMILEEILSRRGKRLSMQQWRVVLNAAIIEPTMLYLNLSVEVISKWRSFEVDVILMPTVKDLIHQIFDDLERQYGKQFTSYALGLITYSRDGINDIEMKDCLSLQKEVLKEVFQYSKLPSFPIHVWLRLKRALKHVIVEKENHCIKWYHRQLWETAQERYLEIKKNCHEIMGRYFGNLVDEEEKKVKGIHDQPFTLNNVLVWFPTCKINSRRVREAYYHLIEAEMINKATEEICSLDMVCASAVLKDGYNLVSSLGRLYNSTLKDSSNIHESCVQRINDYFRWIRKEMSRIMKNPRLQVSVTAGAEPTKSIVNEENSTKQKSFRKGRFNEKEMVWVNTLHGKKKHDSMLSNWQANSDVYSVKWNHDGSKIASGSKDKTIKIWDSTTGEVINTLEGHSDVVSSVSWNHDGSKIASGSYDKTIKIWDSITAEVINTLEGHSDVVSSVSWNHDGSKIASGSRDKTIKIWDTTTGEVSNTLEGHLHDVRSVPWNHDGSKIASGSYDKTIKIWDSTTGEVINSLEGHSRSVNSVSWNHDGNKIASGSDDNTVKIWDSAIGEMINTFEGHCGFVCLVSWNHDGSKIASGSRDNTIKVWDSTSGEEVNALEGHRDVVSSVSWNHEGSRIATGSYDKTIKILNSTIEDVFKALEGHGDVVISLSWNHDGSMIATGSYDKTVKIWDTTTDEILETFEGHSDVVSSVSWNNGGNKIASGSYDMTIKIWDSTGEVINTLDGHSDVVSSVSWNHDGSKIASGSRDKTIKIWDSTTGEVINTLVGHLYVVNSVSWNHDGNKIASGSYDKTIKIWDSTTGEVINTLDGHSDVVTSVSWNHDGSKIASGSDDRTIKIWDSTTGEVISTSEGHSDAVSSVSWNHDGSKIASGSYDETIKIWDSTTGEVINTLDGHSRFVRSVSWSHDGSKIASGSDDRTIKIWDATTEAVINSFEEHSLISWNVLGERNEIVNESN